MDSAEKKEYSFNKNYPRDLIGYGATPPHAAWPNKARVAVQFVLNYEEGAENNVLHGDAGSEQFLSDIIGAASYPDRHMSMDSLYEYGSRAGFWRIHREFQKRGLPLTVFGVAMALARLRRDIQFIFQDPYASLDPRLTVGFSIMEPLLVHKVMPRREAEQRVAWLLEKVGLLPEHAQRYPHEFSGGQRQRICIARALALNPKVVIADESVSALDVSIQAQIVNLMLDLQREFGIAFLFISHDMAVVERISHRVAVMYLGQIVEMGPRQAVFEQPRHPYTRKLMAAVPVADPAHRRRERALMVDEIPSAVRALGDEPEVAPLMEVAPGHFVARHAISST